MSLAQHVTNFEGFDYEGPANPSVHPEVGGEFGTSDLLHFTEGDDTNRSEWRRLSFAPVEVPHEEPHIAAYKVSNARRYAQIVAAVLACWLASGIVFGFAALKPVLVAEGVYQELCEYDDAVIFGEDLGPYEPCAEQDLRLNLFFVAASITTNISSLFAGAAVDRFGRRVCWLLSCVFLAVGCLLMGYSFAIPEFDAYLLGNVFLGLGGTFLFVPSFQLANAFPKHSGIIVALITGAFDASAAVFLFYRMAYDSSGGKFSVDKFFFGYLIVPALIFITEFALMPVHAYHTTLELEEKIEKVQDRSRDVHESDEEIDDMGELRRVRSNRAERRVAKLEAIEEIVGDEEQREERVKLEEERQEVSGVWGVLHGVPAYRQMLTPWFVLILLLTILQMLRMNYFIATVRAQYRYLLGTEGAAEKINDFFDVALPLGGVLSTPFIGLLLNKLSVPSLFVLMSVLIALMGVLNCVRLLWTGYATVVLFVLFRPLYYSAISDYATKVFGFATFGRIYGTIVCISGMTNFAQSGFDALTHGPLHDDPTVINATMGVLGTVLGVALAAFVFIKGRVFVEEKTELEADQERQRLLSDAVHHPQNYGGTA